MEAIDGDAFEREKGDVVRTLEEEIRSRRVESRRAEKASNQIPCRDPGKGPNVGELLNYFGERNRLMEELKRKPKPASAYSAGVGDNGGDITDLAVCHRTPDQLALELDRPEMLEIVRRRAAQKLGVPHDQVQSRESRERGRRAAWDSEDHNQPSLVFEEPKLPKEIARANEDHKCDFCGFAGTRFRCSRCKRVRYCSAACQKRHWKAGHHEECCSY